MDVVIIEDEKLAADNLEMMIRQIEPAANIVAKLESVGQSVKWFSNNKADLLFVDIMLADGNSFQLFENIKINIPVIFTTAYDQFAIRAFKLNSIGYLLKPINYDDLEETIKKFNNLHSQQSLIPNWDQLLDSLKNPIDYQNRFLIHAGEKIRSVKTSEIAYFQSKEGATFIGTFDNKYYNINQSLEQLENILDPAVFFRINRQFIVNIESIKNMTLASKSRIKIDVLPKPDEETIVSVKNIASFKEWLNK